MTENPSLRGARGRYAPLICLNCKSRKIKCHLPKDVDVQPSDQSQPWEKSCQRCRDSNLECIVRQTILGRPATKRKRKTESQLDESTMTDGNPDKNDDIADSTEFQGYLLSELAEDSTELPEELVKDTPNTNDMFEAMISPPHLMSAMLSRNRCFGSSIVSNTTGKSGPLSQLITNGMATLLDENLPWHRFYLPLTPSLVSLRQCILHAKKPPNPASELLFALLCLIALDAPWGLLRDDPKLRFHLTAAVSRSGQQFLFALPTHRHSLTVLLLMHHYRPTALATSQEAAATTTKSGLYITLAYQVAVKLGLDESPARLRDYAKGSTSEKEVDFLGCIADALEWCSIMVLDATMLGFVTKPLSAMKEICNQIVGVVESVEAVIKHHSVSASLAYHFGTMRSWAAVIQSMLECKENWYSLENLARIIRSHEDTCSKQQTDFSNTILPLIPTEIANETAVVDTLMSMRFRHHQILVSGLALFYGVLSSVKCDHVDAEIEPASAVQVNNAVIKNLKAPRSYDVVMLTNFLVEFGEARNIQLERTLLDFIQAADTLQLEDVPYLPPPRNICLHVLFDCKVFVEDNAARMKGWQGLHPNVDEHLALLDNSAKRIETMSKPRGGSTKDAFANGCLYAATAKLLRALHSIVMGWKTSLAASSNTPETTSDQTTSTTTEPDILETFDALEDLDLDELLGEWSNWPQLGMDDFLQIPLDDSMYLH